MREDRPMRPRPWKAGFVVLGALTCAAVVAVPPIASGAAVKPVIGRATATPAQAIAGLPFAVAVKITRSDTGRPLARGLLVCRPAVGSKALAHTQSFKGGVARCSFTIPPTAT